MASRSTALIWDLDKTYLDTRFESFRSLLRIPFEGAEKKHSYRSAASFLQAFTHGLKSHAEVNLTFITASPPLLRKNIWKKFALDGLDVDALILKNASRNIWRRQFVLLRNHFVYKLGHLLYLADLNPDWRFFCFGDDWEMDLLIYVAFRDLLAGELSIEDLGSLARQTRLEDDTLAFLLRVAERVAGSGQEVMVFLHRVRYRPLRFFQVAGRGILAFDSYLQLAARCVQEEWLSQQDFVDIWQPQRRLWRPAEVWFELASGVRHGLIDPVRIAPLAEVLDRHGDGLGQRLIDYVLHEGLLQSRGELAPVGKAMYDSLVKEIFL